MVGLVCAVFVLAVITTGGIRRADELILVFVAAAMIAAASRFPAGALGIIIAYTPFQLVLLAWLFKLGAPAGLVRNLGYVKDAMTVAIGVAALESRRVNPRRREPFGFLEWTAGAYLALTTFFLVVPLLVPGSLGGQTWYVRLNAWRIDCLFVILMLFCSRTGFRAAAVRRLATIAVAVGVIEFAATLWEQFSRTSYSNFFVHTINLAAYQSQVLRIQPALATTGYIITGTTANAPIRAGGFSTSQIELGFLMVVPFAIGMQRLVSSPLSIRRVAGPVSAAGAAILAILRSAIIGCLVALLLVFLMGSERSARSRLPVLLICVLSAGLLLPVTSHSGVGQRFDSIFHSNSSEDNQQHSSLSHQGYDQVIAHPLGRGLGANPATGDRFHTTNAITTENSYLQVATEIGIPGMAVFILMYLALVRKMWAYRRDDGVSGDTSTALIAAGAGLAVGGLFLQVWTDFAVSMTFWGLSGAIIGHARGARSSHDLEAAAVQTDVGATSRWETDRANDLRPVVPTRA